MGNIAAVLGVVLLVAGVVLLALLGNRRSFVWAQYIGVALVVLGMGVEVAGAVAVAA
jgi:uncharacterized membrane protein